MMVPPNLTLNKRISSTKKKNSHLAHRFVKKKKKSLVLKDVAFMYILGVTHRQMISSDITEI